MSKLLYSPDGKMTIKCNDSQVENMKAQGWTEKQINPKPKKEVKKDGTVSRQ